jgi:NADPH-dependent 2,4-dienoyl-CoA reductase/sulfur reductase-like enzyme
MGPALKLPIDATSFGLGGDKTAPADTRKDTVLANERRRCSRLKYFRFRTSLGAPTTSNFGMPLPNKHEIPVLIVGAGPTGLVLALWLAHLGVRVRIMDKTAEPGTTSRALAVQVHTLEFYQQIGTRE